MRSNRARCIGPAKSLMSDLRRMRNAAAPAPNRRIGYSTGLRGLVTACVLVFAFACVSQAQQTRPATPPPPAPATPAPATSAPDEFAPIKQLLDQIQQAIGHGGHTDQRLTELREKLAPIRDGLRDRFDVLDPRLAEVDSRLSQLGPAPAAGAPPEAPTIAEERAKLSQSRAEVDAALKETRLLSLRADDVAAR